MAVAYSAVAQPGLLSQQYPPPLLPKPGKDNVKLRKLLKRTAKKKVSAQATQSVTHFRSSLSPVNEASPDLERSDHSTPPKTPETPFSLSGVQQSSRFTARPLYQHVASPYPRRAAYGREVRWSPQTVAMLSQHVSTFFSYSPTVHLSGASPTQEAVTQLAVPTITLPTSSAPVAAEVKKPILSTFSETNADLGPAAGEVTQQPKHTSPSVTPATGGQSFIRPLTVLTPLVKPRSPRPTFIATEPSRSPKPMFDVPKIRMYTASTSYYETSRIPPVHDSAGLTAIGSAITQSKIPTETKQELTESSLLGPDTHKKTTLETKRGTPTPKMITIITPTPEIKRLTPTPEIKRATPTSEIKRATPTAEIKRVTPTPEIKRATPTSEIKRATPTAEIKRVTLTPEIKRATPTSEIKRATPTAEIKRVTPTPEIKRAIPTAEIKRVTPTPEIKRSTPTAEIKRVALTPVIKRATSTLEIKRTSQTSEKRVKTPTYELQILATSMGRPKTPAYHITRAITPVFEISKPNPLLFAVSPITVEQERSRTPQTVSAISITESKPAKTILNAVINPDMTLAAEPIHRSITKSKSEADLTKENIESPTSTSQRLSQLTMSEPATPEVTSHGCQRPKTPTYEASRLRTTSPGYTRPRTPTYGTSSSGVSPVVFQRPKTPLQVVKTSSYRGLTPAEYTAYGGIKTYSPAFGISTSKMETEEEVKAPIEVSEECKTPNQEPSMKILSTVEISKVKETANDKDKPQKDIATLSVPTIIVSQTSDISGTTVTQEISVASSKVAAKQEKTVIQETPKPPTVLEKTPEKQTVVKPTPISPDVQHPPPKGDDQDPLKAVKKLLGKGNAQTARLKSGTETKAVVSDQQGQVESLAATKTGDGSSKPSPALPALPKEVSTAESEEKKSESINSAPEKKEGGEYIPAAEPLLKVMQKPKGMKSKMSGWSRLKKHMVVEQEEPKFPETGSQSEATEQDQSEVKKVDEKADSKSGTQDEKQTKDPPKATKMWDAVLFQMFSTKENIMHQIDLNKSPEDKEKAEEIKDQPKEIPSFAHRLPVLLFSPRFDAKKLREAASRPVTKISTVFEMGLIGRKGKDEEPKDFNRKARGFITAT